METKKRKSKVNISTDDFDPDSIKKTTDDKSAKKNETKASRKAKTSAQSNGGIKSVIDFICDKNTRRLYGVIISVVALYLSFVCCSFLSVGDLDQSMVNNLSFAELLKETKSIKNTGGPLGAYISDLFIAQGLGIGSFVIILYLFALAYICFGGKYFRFWSLTFKCALISITLSVVVGLLTFNSNGFFHLGGDHGHFVNEFLINASGIWGAIGVSIILVTAVALIFFNEICAIVNAIINAINQRRERIRQESRKNATETENKNDSSESAELPQDDIDDEFSSVGIDDFSIDNDGDDTYNKDNDTNTDADDLGIEFIDEDNDGPTIDVDTPVIEQAEEIINNIYDPTAELSKFVFPSIDLLHKSDSSGQCIDKTEREENKKRIISALNDFGIEIKHIKATVGPTVTLYELIPNESVRIAKIKRLEDDIALKLAALGIRIIAPIPGKGTIGIEVPNKEPQIVSMHSIITSKAYQDSKAELPMAIGVTISNEVFIADLTKMPHLLVAGATGMGKSVGLNAIITSLLYKKHPAELKFVLIDPKMVEFSRYRKLERHYLAKLPDEDSAIITNPEKVTATLNSLCIEMDNRYSLLTKADVVSIKEYNAKFINHRLNPEKGHRYLPYIVVIVDEFADLIMTAGKEIETPVARIAQKARAVGIHMILATQRPSTNVVTGIIKANFPGRVAFRVNQMVDSRTILDRPGANQLIGKGDMLFSRDGIVDRVQCAFISNDEVVAICDCIDEQIGYEHAYELPEFVPEAQDESSAGAGIDDRDPRFDDAARLIIKSSTASTSSLQRVFKIGYNRAGRIMDQMEAAGIVGPSQGGKPRQVLVDAMQLERILANKQ